MFLLDRKYVFNHVCQFVSPKIFQILIVYVDGCLFDVFVVVIVVFFFFRRSLQVYATRASTKAMWHPFLGGHLHLSMLSPTNPEWGATRRCLALFTGQSQLPKSCHQDHPTYIWVCDHYVDFYFAPDGLCSRLLPRLVRTCSMDSFNKYPSLHRLFSVRPMKWRYRFNSIVCPVLILVKVILTSSGHSFSMSYFGRRISL